MAAGVKKSSSWASRRFGGRADTDEAYMAGTADIRLTSQTGSPRLLSAAELSRRRARHVQSHAYHSLTTTAATYNASDRYLPKCQPATHMHNHSCYPAIITRPPRGVIGPRNFRLQSPASNSASQPQQHRHPPVTSQHHGHNASRKHQPTPSNSGTRKSMHREPRVQGYKEEC